MKSKKKQPIKLITNQPLVGGSFTNWLNLLISNGGVDPLFILKALYVSLGSCLGIPFRTIEKIRFDKKIDDLEIKYPPIFIIGFWRSGTTYLHTLMSQDSDLGYISRAQAWGPGMFLVTAKIWTPIVNSLLPETRPMDNMKYVSEEPEEEEYAMSNLSPYSFYHTFNFPRNFDKYFQYLIFDEVDESIRNQWKQTYINLIKKVTFSVDMKRLILKNPSNTARIKLLLEMFPDAKFIHIYRNPYIVYQSQKNTFEKILPYYTFQLIKDRRKYLDLYVYKEVMQRFFLEKDLIPSENFVEIKYEDFVGNELIQLQRIYKKFNLPSFEKAKENFQQYLDSQSNYQTNQYSFDEETIAKVYDAWKFTIDKWEYTPPPS